MTLDVSSFLPSSLNVLQWILNVISLPLVAMVLYVLVRDRTHAGSFFTVYKVGLTYDIIALIVFPIIGCLPTRGHLLRESFLETQLYLIMYHFFNYGIHFCQLITNTLICLNRATAVLFPHHHDRFWCTPFLLPCCFLFQFGAGCLVGTSSLRFEMYLLKYDTGERFPMVVGSPEIQRFFTQVFVSAVILCSSMIVLYAVVIWKFRSNMKSMHTVMEGDDSRIAFSLLCISVVVIGWEAIVCVFYWNLFVGELDFDRDFRMQYVVYYCIVTLYSGVPTYLLLVFYKPIRREFTDAVFNIFGVSRKLSTTSVGIMVKISTAGQTTDTANR